MANAPTKRLEVLKANKIDKGFDKVGSTSENSADHLIAELKPRQSTVVMAMFKKAIEDPNYGNSLLRKFELVISPEHVDYEG